jgi:hypothetical protein
LNSKDLPVGIKFKINVPKNSFVANDTMSISLSHFPDATKKDGINPSNETDIFVKIPVSFIKK